MPCGQAGLLLSPISHGQKGENGLEIGQLESIGAGEDDGDSEEVRNGVFHGVELVWGTIGLVWKTACLRVTASGLSMIVVLNGREADGLTDGRGEKGIRAV